RRLLPAAADGGCRSRPPPRPQPSPPHRGAVPHLGATLSPRRLLAPAAAQPLLFGPVFRRCSARPAAAALWLMRRHLILFVRAPLLGVGKRRLAREIGDVAAVRFEQLMIALLQRRLAADR